ncbi:MAG: hypothetical protein WAL91_03845, partial [Propionicimonas sp.]
MRRATMFPTCSQEIRSRERPRGAPGTSSKREFARRSSSPTRQIVGSGWKPELATTMPGVIQLGTVLRVEGLNPDHVAHDAVATQQAEFRASVLAELQAEDRAGRLREGLDLPVIARLITALVEGIQIAWLADATVDMGAHLEAFME